MELRSNFKISDMRLAQERVTHCILLLILIPLEMQVISGGVIRVYFHQKLYGVNYKQE